MKRVAVDIGGTFTDVVVYDDEVRSVERAKVMTDHPRPERSFMAALDQAGAKPTEAALLLHGTTIVTNLLVERTGARVALITTRGFRDLLDIQLSIRPNPFDYVRWRKPVALVPRELRFEVDERVSADGEVLLTLDEAGFDELVRGLTELSVESVAVAFLHSFANPVNEIRAGEILRRRLQGVPISLSHEVDPTMREYERTSTTVINAYAQPAVHGYIERLEKRLPVPVRYMHSGGGIIPADSAKRFPVMLASSGPAGGVLAGVYIARSTEHKNLITFDMGGTSCDVALVRGERPTMTDAIEVEWNIPARTLAVDVNSVGAGGGSIAWVDPGAALMVGPQSSGSHPGPACYGFGGTEPTVTDANLLLGLIAPNLLGGRLALSEAAAARALSRVGQEIGLGVREAAEAVYSIVNMTMAAAIRQITVEKGIDPRDFSLVSFGGAGGQHAVAVARELGITTVIFPPHASTFSAMGMLVADLRIAQSQTMFGPFDAARLASAKEMIVDDLGPRAIAQLECDIKGAADPRREALLDLRYIGQSHYVAVDYRPEDDDVGAVVARFEDEHERLFGTRLGDPIELVNVHVIANRTLPTVAIAANEKVSGGEEVVSSSGDRSREVVIEGTSVHVISRDAKCFGAGAVAGPVLIEEVDSVHYVPAGWTASLGWAGSIIAEQSVGSGE